MLKSCGIVLASFGVATVLAHIFVSSAILRLSDRIDRQSLDAHAAMASALGTVRSIKQVVPGQKMMEGAGVRICRTVGTHALRNLDPFLMLDELKCPSNEAAAGFPDHPHRGFETCSIMISGKIEHKDSAGNKLWINLPAKDKMIKPRYQDYQAKDIPIVSTDKLAVRVMAGEFEGQKGPIELRNPGLLMDVKLGKGGSFQLPFPAEWNAFCYVFEGTGTIGGAKAPLQSAVVLEHGDYVQAETQEDAGLRFLLIAGKPIGESIVQHGPFVMNTQEEIREAFRDYQSGKLQNPNDDVWKEWVTA